MSEDIKVTDGTVLESLNNKADRDLLNLTEEGEKHFLNKSQITNCLLEVPQRIKYDLTDGVLTIKAGSVVIVPYGVEDLTAQYPVGATFLNDNFKVADTQFAGGKFFVWAELVGDATNSRMYDQNEIMFVDFTQNILQGEKEGRGYSGNTAPTLSEKWGLWYDINANLVKLTLDTGATWAVNYSFPVMLTTNTTSGYTGVNQVFNGMGYIGSTVWCDKGVKGLIPNGRNEDGTLKNYEFTSPNLLTSTLTGATRDMVAIIYNGGTSYTLYRGFYKDYKYNAEANVNMNIQTHPKWDMVPIGTTEGDITKLVVKQPITVADIQDVVRKTGDTMSGRLTIDTSDAYSIALITPTDYNTAPTANTYNSIRLLDRNGLNIGGIQYCHRTTGVRDLSLIINDGADTYSALKICVDANGTFTANAPTPATGDNSTKIATTAFCKNMATTTKATTTSSASATRPAWVVQNYKSGTTWRRIWSDGWIEQGGKVTVTRSNYKATITFPKAFSDTNYNIMFTAQSSDAAYFQSDNINVSNDSSKITKTSIEIASEAGNTFYWRACGY